ncbi:uncharacterized protein METZ01_LOCUS493011, partial [marine metagenome]
VVAIASGCAIFSLYGFALTESSGSVADTIAVAVGVLLTTRPKILSVSCTARTRTEQQGNEREENESGTARVGYPHGGAPG